MHCIEGRHDGRQLLLQVGIIGAAAYADHKRTAQPYLSKVPPFNGLIDTGATTTMVSTAVVRQLGLISVNRLAYESLDGSSWKPGHLFHMAFIAGVAHHLDIVADRSDPMDRLLVCRKVINGGEITTSPSFDVLIGMDVISTGTLTISNDGTFNFQF